MENDYSIARPYAKAIFEIALRHGKLNEWSQILATLSKIVSEKETNIFLTDPRIAWQDKMAVFLQAGEKFFDKTGINFIKILAANKRLGFLPQIATLFINEVNAYKNIISITVFTSCKLANELKAYIDDNLRIYFKKEIIVDYQVDKTIIGGIIIKAKDRVIDGSVLGKLSRLKKSLSSCQT